MNAHNRDWRLADVIELIDTTNPDLTEDEIEDVVVPAGERHAMCGAQLRTSNPGRLRHS